MKGLIINLPQFFVKVTNILVYVASFFGWGVFNQFLLNVMELQPSMQTLYLRGKRFFDFDRLLRFLLQFLL